MQRTVYSIKFTYAKTTIADDGTLKTTLEEIKVPETNPKKAYKKAEKQIGSFAPIKTEEVSELYVLDDDIFFKYAKVKTDEQKTKETEAEGD